MARYMFGGGVADWTLSTVTVSTVPNVAQVTGGVTVTFWSAETAGDQYTDLLDSDGAAVSAIVSADGAIVRAPGQIPPFWGPDGVTEMWASANGGPRSRMLAMETPAGAQAKADAAQALSAQRAANLSDLASAATARTNLGLGGAAVLAVGTMAGTVTAGDDSRIRRARALPVPVTDNTFMTGDGGQGQTGVGTTRSPYSIAGVASDIQLVYGNFYPGADPFPDTDGPNTVTIRASIEVSGTIYRASFRGSTTAAVEGGTTVISDPISITVPANTTIYVRTYHGAGGSTWYPTRVNFNNSGNGGYSAGSDLTGSGTIADSQYQAFQPIAILGVPASGTFKTALIAGDSIAAGQGDLSARMGRNPSFPSSSGGGYLARGLWRQAGVINAAIPSDCAYKVLGSTAYRRLQLATRALTMVSEYGTNDVAAGRTVAQIQADLIGVWTLGTNRGMSVIQTTITPRSTSTDSWATTANQTPGAFYSNQAGVNAWLRAGAPIVAGAAVAVGTPGAAVAGDAGHPLVAVWDVAALAEPTIGAGIWRAGYTSDGIHPNTTGSAALAAAVVVTDVR